MTEWKNIELSGVFTRFDDQINPFRKALLKYLGERESNLKSILDRGIRFSDNMDVDLVSFTSNGSVDTEDTTAHSLGKVPTGIIVYSQDKAGSLYNSGTAFTASNIYTKCSVATVAFKVIVF